MSRITLNVNGKSHTLDIAGDMPLLWVLRDILGLTGTKYGCGEGSCGACTVLADGEPVQSCRITVAEAAGNSFTTIEGLAASGLTRCQKAWLEEDVSQCGYCQPGMILESHALLRRKPKPTDQDIDQALAGHLCRCGTYPRIRKAIQIAAGAGSKS